MHVPGQKLAGAYGQLYPAGVVYARVRVIPAHEQVREEHSGDRPVRHAVAVEGRGDIDVPALRVDLRDLWQVVGRVIILRGPAIVYRPHLKPLVDKAPEALVAAFRVNNLSRGMVLAPDEPYGA